MAKEGTTREERASGVSDAVIAAREAAIEAMEQGVIVLDPKSRVLVVNAAAREMMDVPGGEIGRTEDAIGEPVSELLPPGEPWSGLVDLMETEREGQTEIAVGAGEAPRIFEVRFSPLPDQRDLDLERMLVLRDVTERRRLEGALRAAREAAKAASRAMTEFMSVACHEMRTPITSIKGYTDLLARGTVGSINDTQIGFLDTIRDNADRIALLVSDLSDMARIESGRLRLDLERVDIEDVVEKAVESSRAEIEEKDQELTVEVGDDLPPVRADRERAVQALSNLISNAHKFTPAGGQILVRAERWVDEREGSGVVITVEDNGIGIRIEEQHKVFETFYRSEDREASDVPGSGLGLSIAANLVEMQGGRIWLESAFRQGTTVSFILPAEDEPRAFG